VSDNPRRIVLAVMAVAIAWYAVVLFTWALRPIHDSIPTGNDKDGHPIAQRVTCHTLFEGGDSISRVVQGKTLTIWLNGSRLPDPASKGVYTRDPCVIPHTDAQRVFAIDTLVLLAILGAGGYASVRLRREPAEPVPGPSLVAA
jgi:hypothetical protein